MITMNEARTRLLLRVNAISSILSGIVCLVAADWLHTALMPGADVWLIMVTGAVLGAFGFYVLWVANQKQIAQKHLLEICFLDGIWVVFSVALLLFMPDIMTLPGKIIWGAVALLVLDYAILEALSLRQNRNGVAALRLASQS